MFTMCNVALADVETRDRTTPLNWTIDGMINLGDVHYQTEPILWFFSESDLINNSSFCSHIVLAIDFQCHVFPFEKLLLNVRLCL